MTERPNGGEFKEIISRLEALQNRSPVVDPTANVLGLVGAAIQRQDDLRSADKIRQDDLRQQAEHFNDKLQAERHRADSEARKAEAGRIDSLLAANTNNVALALAKQESQALAQEKRIAVLEQNQYQGVGASGQRAEGRQISQWTFQQVLTIVALAIAVASFVVHIWK